MNTKRLTDKQIAHERATLLARLAFLDEYDRLNKPPRSVLDGHDHTACALKDRKAGYWHKGVEFVSGRPEEKYTWINDPSSRECKYDRRKIDPACSKAGCKRIGD